MGTFYFFLPSCNEKRFCKRSLSRNTFSFISTASPSRATALAVVQLLFRFQRWFSSLSTHQNLPGNFFKVQGPGALRFRSARGSPSSPHPPAWRTTSGAHALAAGSPSPAVPRLAHAHQNHPRGRASTRSSKDASPERHHHPGRHRALEARVCTPRPRRGSEDSVGPWLPGAAFCGTGTPQGASEAAQRRTRGPRPTLSKAETSVSWQNSFCSRWIH